jgi:hypothetical protein
MSGTDGVAVGISVGRGNDGSGTGSGGWLVAVGSGAGSEEELWFGLAVGAGWEPDELPPPLPPDAVPEVVPAEPPVPEPAAPPPDRVATPARTDPARLTAWVARVPPPAPGGEVLAGSTSTTSGPWLRPRCVPVEPSVEPPWRSASPSGEAPSATAAAAPPSASGAATRVTRRARRWRGRRRERLT